jgi:hypothetical protein
LHYLWTCGLGPEGEESQWNGLAAGDEKDSDYDEMEVDEVVVKAKEKGTKWLSEDTLQEEKPKNGSPSVFNQTCSGECYQTFVLGPPSGYDNAYFEIPFVRVYSSGSGNTTAPSSAKTLSWPVWLWTLVAGVVLGSAF